MILRVIIHVFLVLSLPGLLPLSFTCAGDSKSSEAALLARKYSDIQNGAANRLSPLPVYLESTDEKNNLEVDIYGVFNHPFDSIGESLRSPGSWCDIVSLHLNIKACTYEEKNGRAIVNVYSGRKFYQSPEDAFLLSYDFSVAVDKPDYLLIRLSAAEGPLDTLDHRIVLEAAPVDSARTLLHFSYSHRYGITSELAMKSYLATLGRGKKGFSITGTDAAGEPLYVGGPRGAIERNSVRYYFAVQAYLDTIGVPEKERFVRRIARWFDLTERFPAQLFELERKVYLASKSRERANQERLQRAVYGR